MLNQDVQKSLCFNVLVGLVTGDGGVRFQSGALLLVLDLFLIVSVLPFGRASRSINPVG